MITQWVGKINAGSIGRKEKVRNKGMCNQVIIIKTLRVDPHWENKRFMLARKKYVDFDQCR